jgi:hypothetical protein
MVKVEKMKKRLDTTNASNITSGTLSIDRLPSEIRNAGSNTQFPDGTILQIGNPNSLGTYPQGIKIGDRDIISILETSDDHLTIQSHYLNISTDDAFFIGSGGFGIIEPEGKLKLSSYADSVEIKSVYDVSIDSPIFILKNVEDINIQNTTLNINLPSSVEFYIKNNNGLIDIGGIGNTSISGSEIYISAGSGGINMGTGNGTNGDIAIAAAGNLNLSGKMGTLNLSDGFKPGTVLKIDKYHYQNASPSYPAATYPQGISIGEDVIQFLESARGKLTINCKFLNFNVSSGTKGVFWINSGSSNNPTTTIYFQSGIYNCGNVTINTVNIANGIFQSGEERDLYSGYWNSSTAIAEKTTQYIDLGFLVQGKYVTFTGKSTGSCVVEYFRAG